MRFLKISVFAVAFLLAGLVMQPAKALDDGSRAQIKAVIESQMAAFKRDDGPAAFAHAAPSIQHMFQTPERFMHMVREGYQAVYRPRYVEFQDLAVDTNGQPHQHVIVEAPDGTLMMAVYPMELDENGNWRISGVYLAPLNRQST